MSDSKKRKKTKIRRGKWKPCIKLEREEGRGKREEEGLEQNKNVSLRFTVQAMRRRRRECKNCGLACGSRKSADGSLGILSFFSLSPRLSDRAESPPSPLSLERVPTLTTVVVSLLLLFPPSQIRWANLLRKRRGRRWDNTMGRRATEWLQCFFPGLTLFLQYGIFTYETWEMFFLVCTRSPVLCFHF